MPTLLHMMHTRTMARLGNARAMTIARICTMYIHPSMDDEQIMTGSCMQIYAYVASLIRQFYELSDVSTLMIDHSHMPVH